MRRKLFAGMLAALMVIANLPSTAKADSEMVSFNGHVYQRIDTGMTWTEAKAYCESLGGYLAVVTTEGEQEFIAELVKDAPGPTYYWLGGTDEKNEGEWAWLTGEAWDYSNWIGSEPNNANIGGEHENYAGIWEMGTWNDFTNNGSVEGIKNAGILCEWSSPPGSAPAPSPAPASQISGDMSAWAVPEIEKANNMGLIPDSLKAPGTDYTKPITRAEFAGVAVKAYESLGNTATLPNVVSPYSDTKDMDVLKAYNYNLMVGTSATQFEPNTLLNREQAATALTRVFKRATINGWTLDTDSSYPLTYTRPAAFADDERISEWAKDSVYFMAANKIITGFSDNTFAPRAVTSDEEARGYAQATREQALAIAVRMVENLK